MRRGINQKDHVTVAYRLSKSALSNIPNGLARKKPPNNFVSENSWLGGLERESFVFFLDVIVLGNYRSEPFFRSAIFNGCL